MNYEELINKIEYHNHLYYDLSQPEVSDAYYDILYDNYGGWENNDGGSGTITINTIEGTWEIEHTWYETQMVDAENEDVYFYF